MTFPLPAIALFVAFVALSAETHVTLEATRADGSIELIPAQNPDTCNAAIDAWRAGRVFRDEDYIRLRCVPGDIFAPGAFATKPGGRI